MFSDLYNSDGELKSAKALVNRREEFINAMSKATYNGLTGRTVIEGESVDSTPLVKSRDTAAAELRASASRFGFAKAANAFNYSQADGDYGQMVKEWTLSSPIPTGLVPYDLSFGIAA